MTEFLEEEACILLPCGLRDCGIETHDRNGDATEQGDERLHPAMRRVPSAPAGSLPTKGRLHAFHDACLERWWAKSCRCPTCRYDVRRSLPPAQLAPPQVPSTTGDSSRHSTPQVLRRTATGASGSQHELARRSSRIGVGPQSRMESASVMAVRGKRVGHDTHTLPA